MFLASASAGRDDQRPTKRRRTKTDYAPTADSSEYQNDVLELVCQICTVQMMPPSTPRSRLYYVHMCGLHLAHRNCKRCLPRHNCAVCREPFAEQEEIDETKSIIFWKAGLRPKCGCNQVHTREAAAKCKKRQTMCDVAECNELFFLHEIDQHYDKFHEGMPVPENYDSEPAEAPPPTCPFEGCTAVIEDIQEHLATCSHRPMQCVCGFDGPLITVETHQQSCKSVKCPAADCVEAFFKIKVPFKRCSHSIREHCPLEALIHKIAASSSNDVQEVMHQIITMRQTMSIRQVEQ